MANDELINSWKRTEAYLLDARANLSQAAEGICADEIHEFNQFIQHNELELALDILEEAFRKDLCSPCRVLELMALAAANMELFDRQRRYDEELTTIRGWKYETVIPKTV